jgi:hypothetical protein
MSDIKLVGKLTGLLLLFGLAALVCSCASNINPMEEVQATGNATRFESLLAVSL